MTNLNVTIDLFQQRKVIRDVWSMVQNMKCTLNDRKFLPIYYMRPKYAVVFQVQYKSLS